MKRYHLFALLFICMVCFNACRSETADVSEPLANVGEEEITVVQFEQALELAKVQYTYKDLQDPDVLQFVKESVLLQLIEDSWIVQRAHQLGLDVADEILNEQIQRIEGDYPEGAFEIVLLEQAISFEDWRESIRKRLLAQAVMRHDLKDSVEITSSDVDAYRKKYRSSSKQSDVELLEEVRAHKREEAFYQWRAKMKKEFPVAIRPEQWAAVLTPSQ